MALAGVHVACGFAGVERTPYASQPLLRSLVWSETMATAGVTAHTAPSIGEAGAPVFEIRSSADVYVAWGSTPDASQASSTDQAHARMLVPANTTVNVYATAGDKLAWVLA